MMRHHIRDVDASQVYAGDEIFFSGLSAAKIGPYLEHMMDAIKKGIEARGMTLERKDLIDRDETVFVVLPASPQLSSEEAKQSEADTGSPRSTTVV